MDILFQGPCSGIPSGRWEAHEWERGHSSKHPKIGNEGQRRLRASSQGRVQTDCTGRSSGLGQGGVQDLSTHIQNLNNFLMFDELPSDASVNKASLENFIGHIAQDVEKFNGEIQAAKARAKAKS